MEWSIPSIVESSGLAASGSIGMSAIPSMPGMAEWFIGSAGAVGVGAGWGRDRVAGTRTGFALAAGGRAGWAFGFGAGLAFGLGAGFGAGFGVPIFIPGGIG